jgi:hypothetical protein
MGVVAASLKFGLSPRRASAQSPPVPCDAWEVEYALTAAIELSETPMGQGDGVYPIGPGRMTLRFEDRGGQPGGRVKLIAYDMQQSFTVVSKTLFWKTTVQTKAQTLGVLDACGEPEGVLAANVVSWKTPINRFRTDGTLTCDGSFCGKFGAPPAGESPLHIGPNPVLLQPLRFSGDMKTFSMAKTFVARMDAPKQTTHLTLAGRETGRSCRAKTCP